MRRETTARLRKRREASTAGQESKPARALRRDHIRVLLVGNQELVRKGLRLLLETQPALSAVSETVLDKDSSLAVTREQPDVILIDLESLSEQDLAFLPSFAEAMGDARILLLTSTSDSQAYDRIFRLGASGMVLKEKPVEVLVKAIEKVHAGELWLDRAKMAAFFLSDMSSGSGGKRSDPETARVASLTRREREVITMTGQGLKNRQLAEQLSISETTVRHHLTSIFSKLEVADRFELVFYAYRHGLAVPPSSITFQGSGSNASWRK